ncbi:DEAD/DEAH box helicase family protein [bacterium]|jgi:non-specific serine/threonine protein kinase|nr:DEAD/DEAH box helicase family protein [bacterium]
MNRLRYTLSIYFDANKRMVPALTCTWHGAPVNLTRSAFLLFLYKHEEDLNTKDQAFSYRLAKYVRTAQIGKKVVNAIPGDDDLAWLFENAYADNIRLYWDAKPKPQLIEWNSTLPTQVSLRREKKHLIAEILNHKDWQTNPLSWMVLKKGKFVFCFSHGKVLVNPSKAFMSFMDRFNKGSKLSFSEAHSVPFITQVYKKNPSVLNWLIETDLNTFLPTEEPPKPKLMLLYEGNTLIPKLYYIYGNEEIEPHTEERTIKDKQTGRLHQRLSEMEEIYQNDLMELFHDNNLPFLLQSPGDIAKFLDQIVPLLKNRDWKIESHVSEDFTVLPDELDLDFNISSSNQNWFEFDQGLSLEGQAMSYPELARLLVENQGYVKTDKGFLKVTDSSQKALEMLGSAGAFRPGSKFSKLDLMPIIQELSVNGSDKESETLIHDFQDIHKGTPDLDENFTSKLRDYQFYGVNWMDFLYKNQFGGILADDMGLGKTVQSLALTSIHDNKLPTLIIGPTNVLYNWQKEINFWTPGKTSMIYAGGNRHKLLKDLPKTDFIITTYGVLKNDIELLNAIPFNCIIVDEAQHIKNPKTQVSKAIKQLQGKFKLALSGTPIENYLQDIWNIMDFVLPNFLGTLKEFEVLSKDDGGRKRIKDKVRPFILRREKREVLDSLPEKTEMILKCPMGTKQMELYKSVLAAAKQGIQSMDGKRDRLHVLTALLKLRQVCLHPGIVKEFQNPNLESAKFELVKDKIMQLSQENHKVVIFSQFTEMLDILENWINEKKIYSERIDGTVSASKRQERIDRFQETDKAGVFMLSLKAGGVGINLTAASYVIHMDPWWNPAIESQATDRVHRMGQKNKVMVYKLITEGTIEEKIQTLQEQKKQLIAEIIDIDSAEGKSLDFSDIKELLSV